MTRAMHVGWRDYFHFPLVPLDHWIDRGLEAHATGAFEVTRLPAD